MHGFEASKRRRHGTLSAWGMLGPNPYLTPQEQQQVVKLQAGAPYVTHHLETIMRMLMMCSTSVAMEVAVSRQSSQFARVMCRHMLQCAHAVVV
jgi:hypothetical protein